MFIVLETKITCFLFFFAVDVNDPVGQLEVFFSELDGAGDVLAWTGDKNNVTSIWFDSWHRWTPQFLSRVARKNFNFDFNRFCLYLIHLFIYFEKF